MLFYEFPAWRQSAGRGRRERSCRYRGTPWHPRQSPWTYRLWAGGRGGRSPLHRANCRQRCSVVPQGSPNWQPPTKSSNDQDFFHESLRLTLRVPCIPVSGQSVHESYRTRRNHSYRNHRSGCQMGAWGRGWTVTSLVLVDDGLTAFYPVDCSTPKMRVEVKRAVPFNLTVTETYMR